jgi:hypothetical protein
MRTIYILSALRSALYFYCPASESAAAMAPPETENPKKHDARRAFTELWGMLLRRQRWWAWWYCTICDKRPGINSAHRHRQEDSVGTTHNPRISWLNLNHDVPALFLLELELPSSWDKCAVEFLSFSYCSSY